IDHDQIHDENQAWQRRKRPAHLTGNQAANAKIGLPKWIGTGAQSLDAANYDAPSAEISKSLVAERAKQFICTAICQSANASSARISRQHPVLVKIHGIDADYWLTDGFVPLEAVGGWAGQPGKLPVPWAIEQTAQWDITLKSLHNAALTAHVVFAGYVREE
ncbi:MAG: hypothetical protein K8I82_04580, partial [Anaerolineae bacterium]|nr:hypothetical protein [Anaerolineae bacterium]